MVRLIVVAVAASVAFWTWSLWEQRDQGDGEVADKNGGMTVTSMQDLDEQEPAAPLVLPVELPRGYGWAGIGTQEGDGEQVWARSVQFFSVNGAPVVELCAKPPHQRRGCAQDDDPFLERSLGDLSVFISFGTVPDRTESAFWEEVELSRTGEELDWLPAG